MAQNISQKYLEAIKALNSWVTVSEWAVKVGELYPEILEKAEKEALAQKNETTGLREITARISSNISRGAYLGKIDIDESEHPRKVRYITESEARTHEEQELEEDLAPISRSQKIRADEATLSTKDKYRLTELESIISQLRTIFNLDFELEHAKALLNPENAGQHHPDNIQILLKSHNRLKSNKNWDRFSIEEQIDYIKSVVKVQKIVSKRMGVDIEDEVIDQIIKRIEAVF
jgi:hypothetical protein